MAEWDVVQEARATPAAAPAGAGEWDVAAEAPVAPPKRRLGAGEIASRAGSAFLNEANAYAAAPAVGLASIADAIGRLVGPRERTLSDLVTGGQGKPYELGATDYLGSKFVVPSLERANRASINPTTETAGPVGNVVMQAAPELGKAVPDLVEGMGLQGAAPKFLGNAAAGPVKAAIEKLVANLPAGMPAGFRRAEERNAELKAAGVDPVKAALESAASGAMTAGQFALPASAASSAATVPGRVLSRGIQGAGIGTSAGVAAQQAENAMAPDSMQQPVFTRENITPQIILNALFGQMGGRAARGGPLNRARLGYEPGPSLDMRTLDEGLTPIEPPVEREPVPAVNDPNEVARLVSEALFRTPEEAPLPPEDVRLVPKDTPMPGPIEPDVSEVPVRVAPDFGLEGGSIAGRMKREFGEPPIAPDQAPSARTAARAQATSDAMRPAVPMRILHTIADAARDSGLGARIQPRVIPIEERAPKVTTERPTERIPAGQQPQGGEATPAARDLFTQGEGNAQRVRSDQGPPREGRGAEQPEIRPGAERGGGDLQQAPQRAPDELGAPRGLDRPQDVVAPVETPRKAGVLAPERRAGSSFLQDVRKAGGIDPAFAAEVGGDTAMQLNRRLPGLMRRGGLSEDGLLEWAQQNGYLNAEEVARADRDLPGGGLGLAKDLMRRAMNGEEVRPAAQEHQAFEQQADKELYDYAASRRIDTAGMSAEDVSAALDHADMLDALREEGLPAQDDADVDLVSRASEIDEIGVERLSHQAEGGDITDEQFMDAVRRIVDGEQSTQVGEGSAEIEGATGREAEGQPGAAREGPPAADERAPERGAQPAGAEGGEARPALELERQSESDLRQRADREERARVERARVANAPASSDFTLTGSNRASDEAAARGQNELFTPDSIEPKKAGGGTLYGGVPLDKVAEALKWAFGDVKAWHDSIGKLANDIRAMADRIPSPEGHPIARFFRAMLDSASGDMRAVLKKHYSETARHVIDQFHTESGSDRVTGEIYSSDVNGWTNKMMTRLDHAIKGLEGNATAMAQIAALVRNPHNIKAGTRIHDAAATIRSLLDDALKHLRDSGVSIGEVRNGYYPREFDMRAVIRDPAGFVRATARAFRENGLDTKEAEASAQQLHDGLVFGETGSIFRTDRGSPQAPFLKGRVFGKQVDSEKHPLYAFLMHDPSQAIPIYLERAAKRAAIATRFGDNFSKWAEIEKKIVAEGGGPLLEKLRDYVTLAARLKAPGVSNFTLRAASIARTWGALMFLEKATLSSLTEFIVPAIRAGNPLDIARSLKNTISDIVRNTEGAAERRAFAEDLGIVSAHLTEQVSAARFSGGEPVSMLESKILNKYFRRTGLTQWTDATFVSAADLGRVFVRRLAKELQAGGGKLNTRYLAELGVPKDKAPEFSGYVLSKNDGMVGAGDLTGPMGELYRAAIRRFTQQSIMRPDATMRPGWMAHPLGSIVGQLQSFNYAFYENVLKRVGRLAKEGATGADYTMLERARLLTPMMMVPLLTAAAFAIGEARDAAVGDPTHRRTETAGQKALKAVSRGSPIAPLDPLLNYLSSARYQRSAADNFAGPVLGTAGKGMDAARQVLLNNTPKTNTAERQAAKAFYDIFIEPTVNLMLTASPVTLAAAAATQAAGAGGVRERFVRAVAGPPKKPPSRYRAFR